MIVKVDRVIDREGRYGDREILEKVERVIERSQERPEQS